MKTIIVVCGAWMLLSLLSCQKQLSLPDAPATDSLPADTLPVFVVTDIWRYDFDTTGTFIADSEHIVFTRDTIALSTTITGEYRDAVNGNYNHKNVFFYNNSQQWLKDEQYDPNNFTILERSNMFYRNAAGDVQRYEYSKEDYSGNPRYFTALFQYRSLPNGHRETTVVDTTYLDYTRNCYYKVEQDNTGKLLRRELMKWSQVPYSEVESYSYDATGQIQKIVDSVYYPNDYINVNTFTCQQEPGIGNALDVFTKEIKGKNFWWYMQDRTYNFNLLYDNLYVGKPLKSLTETRQYFQGAVLQDTKQVTFGLANIVDADNNLSEFLLSVNSKKYSRYKFAYERIK